MRGLRSTLAAAAAASLLLAGCGGGDGGGSAQAGSELVVGAADPAPNLIPGRQTNVLGFAMSVFSPLTFVDAEGELSYIAAESVDSDDQKTWTITLREGWTFHDGTDVTAQDYVDSWNTVAYGPNAFENTGQLAGIAGYEALNPGEGEPETDELSGLSVIDDTTFTVELDAPDSQFPLQLSQAQTAFFPMPKSAFDDLEAYGSAPIGNGPLAVTTGWTEGEPYTAEAYEDYAGEAPSVEKITWVPYTDRLTAYNDTLAGNVDIQMLPATRMNQVGDDFAEDRIHSFDAPGISYLSIPFWDDRFADPRVAKAISMAIDRDTISEKVYGGYYQPATAWTPSIMEGNPDGICGDSCSYDPEAAAALLAEAGGFEGTLTLNFPGGNGHEDLYNAVANYLSQNLGIDAVATPSIGWAEFTEDRKDQVLDGPFFSRWGALYPSQQSTMRAFFAEVPGCTYCGGEPIPEVIEAIDAGDASSTDPAADYARAQAVLAEEFPVIPMFEERYTYVTSDRVEQVTPSAIGEPVLTATVVTGD